MLLLLKSRDTTKSATTLRAVPENTQNEEDIHSSERETSTQSNSPVDDKRSPSAISAATCPKSTPIWRKKHIKKFTGTKCSPKKAKSIDRSASLIGTYKDGKIQWQRRGKPVSINSDKIFQGEKKRSKSNTNVAIPKGRCNQPLPPLPFFDSSFGDLRSRYSVSPSLESHSPLRGSTASPSAHSPPQPTLRRSRRTINQLSVPEPRPPRRSKSTTEMISTSMYSGSIYSQDSSTSSLRSYSSSKTSFEADAPSKPGKPQPSNTSPKEEAGSNKEECHRKPPPTEPPRKYTHQSSDAEDAVVPATCGTHAIYNTPHITGIRGPKIEHDPNPSGTRQIIDPSPRLDLQTQATHNAGSGHLSVTPCSPTLSEAECDLHQQLASFESISGLRAEEQDRTPLAESNLFQWEVRRPSAEDDNAHAPRAESTIGDPLVVPPPLPRKSSKRQSATRNIKSSRIPQNHIASQVRRGRPRTSKTLKLMIPMYRRTSVDVVFSQLPIEPDKANSIKASKASPIISPAGAEAVILSILQNLHHFDDLFAAARINHGFYRVYKRHELELIKATLRTMSPPAWEFREIAFPGHDHLHAEDLEMTRPEEEYTPSTYLQLQKRDIRVIRAIKLVILEKCQSFIRPEITTALLSADPSQSSRVDDALWRIWTFCIIFGSGKGREDDLVAQMDWLSGGALAHQETCTFSITGTDLMNDTLVGMSESFGVGNQGGLSAEQLFDIMELWNCLAVLLQSFEGRTVQARQAGIYDHTDIRGGDIDGEEMMLDEWCYYLMTFGPAAVLKLTGPYHPSDPKGFTIAAENGWVNWKPPAPGNTRRKFLREAASRMYEDEIAHTYARISTRDVQRQQSRMRIQQHISELRQRRASSDIPPMIRMSQERPMSDWDTVIKNLTRPPILKQSRTGDIITHVPTLRSSILIPTDDQSVSELPASRTPSPHRRTFAQPLLPTPTASTAATPLDHRSVFSNLTRAGEHPPLPRWPRTAEPPVSSPSVSTFQSNRDLYTLSSVPSIGSPTRRVVAQPLLPTPSTTTASNAPDWQAYMTGTSMPSVPEDVPFHHPLSASPASPQLVSTLPNHYAFHHRNASGESDLSSSVSPRSSILPQQPLRQNSIYSSPSHEHTAEKAIYRIVEMGFTPEQAREALRLTDLGSGLRVDRAVELLLSRQA